MAKNKYFTLVFLCVLFMAKQSTALARKASNLEDLSKTKAQFVSSATASPTAISEKNLEELAAIKLTHEVYTLTEKCTLLQKKIEEYSDAIIRVEIDIADKETQTEAINQSLHKCASEYHNANAEIATLKQERSEKSTELSRLISKKRKKNKAIRSISLRLDIIDENSLKLKRRMTDLASRHERLNKSLKILRAETDTQSSSLTNLKNQKDELTKQLNYYNEHLSQSRALDALTTRLSPALPAEWENYDTAETLTHALKITKILLENIQGYIIQTCTELANFLTIDDLKPSNQSRIQVYQETLWSVSTLFREHGALLSIDRLLQISSYIVSERLSPTLLKLRAILITYRDLITAARGLEIKTELCIPLEGTVIFQRLAEIIEKFALECPRIGTKTNIQFITDAGPELASLAATFTARACELYDTCDYPSI